MSRLTGKTIDRFEKQTFELPFPQPDRSSNFGDRRPLGRRLETAKQLYRALEAQVPTKRPLKEKLLA